MANEPYCPLCGSQIESLGAPYSSHTSSGPDAVVALHGQWMYSKEFQTSIFVCDPDTELTVISLGTGQLALLPDAEGYPTKHYHQQCLCEATNEDEDDDDDD